MAPRVVTLESTKSTQLDAHRLIVDLAPDQWPDIVFARDQTAGKGRFERHWLSAVGDSLTMTAIHRLNLDAEPWLCGMAMAVAAAEAMDCGVQWPNDLVDGDYKVGGILTQVVDGADGQRVALIGVGLNLNQNVFPEELSARAKSFFQTKGRRIEPEMALDLVWTRWRTTRGATRWSELASRWQTRDQTSGKRYALADQRVGIAQRVNERGALLVAVEGESVEVFAADAWFGSEMAT